jgi:hypothetical protein
MYVSDVLEGLLGVPTLLVFRSQKSEATFEALAVPTVSCSAIK